MVWLQRIEEDAREIRMPQEWGGVVPSEVFRTEARAIVERGAEEGLLLRVMGGVGIRLHTLECEELGLRLARLGTGDVEFTDLDFVSYKEFRKRMPDFFAGMGYQKRRATLSSAASEKHIKDSLSLLYAHELAEQDKEDAIDCAYIANLLAKDWGFWYTLTTNLEGIRDLLPQVDALSAHEGQVVQE